MSFSGWLEALFSKPTNSLGKRIDGEFVSPFKTSLRGSVLLLLAGIVPYRVIGKKGRHGCLK